MVRGTINHRKSIASALALTLLLLLLAQRSVRAAPPLPASFYGTVQINGANVPAGSTLSAWINGVKVAETTSFIDGGSSVFLLDIPGDDPATPTIEGGVNGQTILFQIAGFAAEQSAIWNLGLHEPLNLSVTLTNPDLSVSQEDGRASLLPGEILTYTLSIRNTGFQTATGVRISDTLPSAVNVLAVSNGGAQSGALVTWPSFTLAAGESATRTLRLQVMPIIAAGVEVITNTLTVADDGTHGPDPTPLNNSSLDANTVIAAPDLVMHLDGIQTNGGSSNDPFAGLLKTLSYVLTITNTGFQNATGVVTTDVYPANTGFSSASNGGQRVGNLVTWPTIALSGQTTITRTLQLQVDPVLLSSALVLTNTTSVHDDGRGGPDPTPGNNSASHVITLPPLFPPDADQDGMSDECEVTRGLNPNDPSDALVDSDGDTLLNLDECRAGTDPHAADSDQDGVNDPTELRCGSDALNPASANRPPVITSTPATTANQGQLYSYQVVANDPDGTPPALRLLVAPSGMSMSAAGLITWTPGSGQVGQFNVVVEAGDGGTCPASQPYRIHVPAVGVDLAVASVNIDDVATHNQTLVAVGTVHVGLQNKGTQSFSGSFTVILFEDHNGNAIYDSAIDSVLGTKNFSGTIANQGMTNLDVSLSGVVQFWDNLVYAFVDSSAQLAEIDENNNVAHSGERSRYQPPVGDFQPVVKWRWQVTDGSRGLNTPPLVAPLIDTNGDGNVNERDVPAVIIHTFIQSSPASQHLVALRGDTGQEIFSIANPNSGTICYTCVGGSGLGDLDGDGHIEIIAPNAANGSLNLFNHDGSLQWTISADSHYFPILFNQDSSGLPEFAYQGSTYNANGTVRWINPALPNYWGQHSRQSVDLDLDGVPEVVAGPSAYDSSGNLLWWWTIKSQSAGIWTMNGRLNRGTTTVTVTAPYPIADAWTAAANLDNDPNPELIAVAKPSSSDDSLWIFDHDGRIHSGPFRLFQNIQNVAEYRLGPPTIADFDGDGSPEIAITADKRHIPFDFTQTGALLVVIRPDGSLLWERELTHEIFLNYPPPVSAFDFDGDGAAEIVFVDTQKLYIFDGHTGVTLFERAISEGASTNLPYATVADVDNDGSAEILVPTMSQPAYIAGAQPWAGIIVLGDTKDNWIHARRVWNQWLYNATDVNENGSIPTVAPQDWFVRTQQPIENVHHFAAPDLSVSRLRVGSQSCPITSTITARIGNGGALQSGAGVPVRFYVGDPNQGGSLITTTYTTHPLFPGEFEDITVAWNVPSSGQVFVSTNQVITSSLVQTTNLTLLTDSWAETSGNCTGCKELNPDAWLGIDSSLTTRWLEHPVANSYENLGTAFYEVHFPYPVNAISVTILNNNVTTSRFLSGQLTFSNGYSTLITLDNKGQGTVTFPEQTSITWVRLTETSPSPNPSGAALAAFIVAGSYRPPLFRLNEGVGRQANNSAALLPGTANCNPAANQPPVIISAPPLQAQVGVTYSYPTQAVDPDSDPVTFALLAAPANMAINTETGVIRWTPTVDQGTVVTVTIQASDNRGGITQQTYALTVELGNRPPIFTSTPITTVTVGQTYSYSVAANDPDGDIVIFALQRSPANTAFNGLTGVISWTPTLLQVGTQSFSIAAQDEHGATTVQSFTVVVATAPLPLLPPDLVLSKSNQQTTVAAGATVTYTLTISNSGGQAASAITLNDTLPAYTIFTGASNGGTATAGTVTWPSFNLTVGASVTRTVTLQVVGQLPAGVNTITNTATVADDGSHGVDPTPLNNSASDIDTLVAAPDLAISQDDGATILVPGQTITYTLVISNVGSQDATRLSINDSYPADTTFVRASNGGVDLGGAVSWPFVNLATGTQITRTITLQVDNPLPVGVETMTNTAQVLDDGKNGADPTPANNNASDVDVVNAAPQLAIWKDDGVTQVQPGDRLTYTLTISNVGNQAAIGVMLTDRLPDFTSLITASHEAITATGIITWNIGVLDGQAAVSRTVVVHVNRTLPITATVITNTAEVHDAENRQANASDSDNVVSNPLLKVTKDDGLVSVLPGTLLTYSLTVGNSGNQTALAVVLSDTLPANTTFISASHSGNESGGIVTWSIGDLPAQSIITRTLTLQVVGLLPAGVTAITNTAAASGSNATITTSLDIDSLVAEADLSLSKSDGRSIAIAGELLTYTLTVSNSGNQTAANVILSDTLPLSTTVVNVTDGGAVASNIITWNLGSVAVNERVTRTVSVQIDPSLPASILVLTNTAEVRSGGLGNLETNLQNNRAADETAINHPPLAGDDNATTLEEVPVTVDLLNNDSDPNHDALQVVNVSDPINASVTISGAQVVLTPTLNFSGTLVFSYTVFDGLLSDNATVTVIVQGVNDSPNAVDDAVNGNDASPLTIDVLANDSDVDGDRLVIGNLGIPSSGVASSDGSRIIFTPTANIAGASSFTYTVSDGQLDDTAQVTVTISNANDAPVAVDDTASTNENSVITVAVLANDSDPDNDALIVSEVGTATNGATDTDGMTVVFTPTLGFVGTATFTYTISDGSLTATAIVTVTVNNVNEAPIATDDAASTSENTPAMVDVLANDSDSDGDSVSVVTVALPSNGQATTNGTSVTYTPTVGFIGTVTFTYTISDGVLTASATVTVTVNNVNDPPIALDDMVATTENRPISVIVLANDSDPDGDTLAIISVAGATQGTITVEGTQVVYTPTIGFNGSDSFFYTITDGALSASARVTVTVQAVNDPPNAVDDSTVTAEDSPLAIPVLDNDSDPDGDLLAIVGVTPAGHGLVTMVGPALVYTPAANFYGSDLFTYTVSDGSFSDSAVVTVTVTPVNDPPAALNDSVTTNEDTPATISVLSNDSDPDGDTLTVSLVPAASVGDVATNGTVVIYTPPANFSGEATFTYSVSDGSMSATATVTVTVTSLNDPPLTVDDAVSTSEDTAVTILPLTNDVDPEGNPLTITQVETGGQGTVTSDGTTISFTPPANVNGTLLLTYTVSDGSLTASANIVVNITPVNDAPVAVADTLVTDEDTSATLAVLANDTDVDGDALLVNDLGVATHGSITSNGTTLTYTPIANFNGSDLFTYTVSDGSLTSVAQVVVTVRTVNDAPIANSDNITAPEDTTVAIPVLNNDSDIDGDLLQISTVSQVDHGTVSINGTSLQFTPEANFNGVVAFGYTVSDGSLSDIAQVTINIEPVNDPPSAADDQAVTDEDSAVALSVLLNDSDVDGDGLTVSAVGSATQGTTTSDGSLVHYTPASNFFGSDSFTYTVSDGNTVNTATVLITVNAVNDVPIALDDAANTNENTTVLIAVLNNDSDPDGDLLIISAVSTPSNGTVTVEGNSLLYTPTTGFSGNDLFSYEVSDGVLTNTASVAVNINAINHAPIAMDDLATTPEDTAITIAVFSNDQDTDNDSLIIDRVGSVLHGTLSSDGTTLTYLPATNFNGQEVFTYTVSDGSLTSSASVTVTITAVNDPPKAQADLAQTLEDTTVAVDVLLNDSDPENAPLTVIVVNSCSTGNGTTNGTVVTFTPAPNMSGNVTCTYTISDGLLSSSAQLYIEVTAVNDAPQAVEDSVTTNEDQPVMIGVLANDTDADGDGLSLVAVGSGAQGVVSLDNGMILYTPAANVSGSDRFTYTISDGTLQSSANVIVTILPVNDAPSVINDLANTAEDTPVVIEVLVNDSDIDSSLLTVQSVGNGNNGTVTTNGTTVTFIPSPNFNGIANFSYTVSDGNLSQVGQVDVNVEPVNDAPIAIDDSSITNENNSVTVNVLANDSDIDSTLLTVSALTLPSSGNVTTDGTVITFTPTPFANGTVVFSYTVSDGLLIDSATVTISVRAVNDPPIAHDDLAMTNEDTPLTIDVLHNDLDPDLDPLLLGMVGIPTSGSATNVGAQVVYTPALNFNGLDSFMYAVSDGLLTANARVTVTVNAVNDAPIAVNDIGTTSQNQSLPVNVLANDLDPDGDPVILSSVGVATHGTAAIVGNTVLYTPQSGYSGSDSFSYLVSDPAGATASATVQIVVQAVDTPTPLPSATPTSVPVVCTQGCYKFELLSSITNANGTNTLTFRVTKTCNTDISYLAFGTNSWSRVAPSDGSTYTGMLGSYRVVWTTTSGLPGFASIKFETLFSGYSQGATDTFTITLNGFNPNTSIPVEIKAGLERTSVSFWANGQTCQSLSTPTPTATASKTPSASKTPTPTRTPTPTKTRTKTPVPAYTPTSTKTQSFTKTPSKTPVPVYTPTPTKTQLHTKTPSKTPVPTSTATVTPLAGSLSPVLECVRDNGNGTYRAFFGYNNPTNALITILIGTNNKFTPSPENRGQPSTFLVGRQRSVFWVDFPMSGNLVWKLGSKTSTASISGPRCS